MASISDFKRGDFVRYTGRAAGYTGRTATVRQPVKGRQVVTIIFDGSGEWFDARPENLEHFDCMARDGKQPDWTQPYRYELTPAGEQAVIPGTERKPVPGKRTQLSLWDVA